jgi:hypothetical protein
MLPIAACAAQADLRRSDMKMMKKWMTIGLLLFAGCATTRTLHTRQEMDDLRHYRTLGCLNYVGSDGMTNYFVKSEFLSRTRRYSCSQEVFPISNRFPKTEDRNKWVPYVVSLSQCTEGFVGEPQEKIETGSPNHTSDGIRQPADGLPQPSR